MVRTVAIQIETTGLSADTCRITEIYAMAMEDGKPTGEIFHSLLNPHQALSADASKHNRVAQSSLDNAPDFAKVASDFADFIKDATPVFFNPHFTRSFFNKAISELPFELRDTFSLERNKALDGLLAKGNFINIFQLAKSLVKTTDGNPLPHYTMQDIAVTLDVDHAFKAVKRCNAEIDCHTLTKIYGKLLDMQQAQVAVNTNQDNKAPKAELQHEKRQAKKAPTVKAIYSEQAFFKTGVLTRAKRHALEESKKEPDDAYCATTGNTTPPPGL